MTDGLTRARLLEARKVRAATVRITLPELGEIAVTVRKLSWADVMAVAEGDKSGWEQCRRCLCQPDGSPLFGPEDEQAFLSLDSDTVVALLKAIAEVNPPPNEREIAKN